MTDVDLVAAHSAGDPNAFRTIVGRYHQRLRRTARRHTRCDDDAHDVLQEAYLKAARYLHRFRGECSLPTWLHLLVLNACFDQAKKAHRREETAILDDAERGRHLQDEHSYNPGRSWDAAMLVNHALPTLPEPQREAIRLVDLHDFSIERAAQIQGVSPGTIKSRRARARRSLKEWMEAQRQRSANPEIATEKETLH